VELILAVLVVIPGEKDPDRVIVARHARGLEEGARTSRELPLPPPPAERRPKPLLATLHVERELPGLQRSFGLVSGLLGEDRVCIRSALSAAGDVAIVASRIGVILAGGPGVRARLVVIDGGVDERSRVAPGGIRRDLGLVFPLPEKARLPQSHGALVQLQLHLGVIGVRKTDS